MKIKLNRNLAIILLIIATFFWGSTFAFTKELTGKLTPLWVVAIRFSITAIILLCMFLKPIISTFKTPLNKELPKLILLGLLNFAAIILQTTALSEIEATNTGFITSFALLLVPFLEFFFWKKPVKLNIKIAVVILLFGIYILSYGFGLPVGFRIGDLLAFISAVIYSFYIIMVDILSKKVNAGALMFFVFIITSIISLPIAIVFNGNAFSLSYDFLSNLGFNTYYNMGFLIILGTIIPYIFMGMGQRVVDAQTASLIYILEPLFAMVIAIIFFNEAPVIIKFIGGGIILAALFIGIREPKQKNEGGNLSNQKSQNS